MEAAADHPGGAPIGADEFTQRMDRLGGDRLGGFPSPPLLGLAVSGGADSMALALLAQRWAEALGGRVVALTVDHGLRPDSAWEAARVAAWLAQRGIEGEVLVWRGDKPASGIQAAARAARRALLTGRCRELGLPDLAFAHHADDQAETVLMRLARGSGVDGLAGMPAVSWVRSTRILRPLLDLRRGRLAATCRAFGQDWVEDPSNASARYARGRLRAAAAGLAAEGLTVESLCATARRAGQARAALEEITAGLLAHAASLQPEGWVSLDPGALAAAPLEIRARALTRALAVVGGGEHPPRGQALERVLTALDAGLAQARTLAGCRVLMRRGRLVIVREPIAAAQRLSITPGQEVWWDRRFSVRLVEGTGPLVVARLGREGWGQAVAADPDLARLELPEPVRVALPGLWASGGEGRRLVAVPAFGEKRWTAMGLALGVSAVAWFNPPVPLAGPPFFAPAFAVV